MIELPVLNDQLLICFGKMTEDRFIVIMDAFQLYMLSKIDTSAPEPFIN